MAAYRSSEKTTSAAMAAYRQSHEKRGDLELLYDSAISDCEGYVPDIEILFSCKQFLLMDHRVDPPWRISEMQEQALRLTQWVCRADIDVLLRICPSVGRSYSEG